jgi:hypothetical protein
MATVLEKCAIEEQLSVVRFLWTKQFNAKDIHKEMFPVYGGKCFLLKAVHNWAEKCGKSFADDEEFETDVRKWLRQQSKDFYAAGFDALVKRWDKCISVAGGYVEKYFFSIFEYYMFYVLYRFVTYLLTLPRLAMLCSLSIRGLAVACFILRGSKRLFYFTFVSSRNWPHGLTLEFRRRVQLTYILQILRVI